MIRVNIKTFGSVQGVFFRRSAKLEAEKLGIVGWVRNKQSFSANKQSFSANKNLSFAQNLDSRNARIKQSLRSSPAQRGVGLDKDGSVEVMAQGEKDKIDEFVKWCKKGPPLAKVKKVEVVNQKGLENFDEFSII